MTVGTCWVVTDGAAGNVKPSLALAEALGAKADAFVLTLRKPWEWLAPHFRNGGRRAIKGPLRNALNGPLPDLLITCGRRATLASTTIKRLSGGRTFTVHLLDPKVDPALFDLVVCPQHDALAGDNVLPTLGSLNAVSDSMLLEARQRWAPSIADHPAPRFAVLIGASNRGYTIDAAMIDAIADVIDRWRGEHGGSVLVTTSRRSSNELKQHVWRRFGGAGRVWTGDSEEQNPYPGFLAYADAFIVTPDSINMCSEAAACGKPVFVPEVASKVAKFDAFHREFRHRGYARILQTSLDLRPTEALRETPSIAAEVLRRYQNFQQNNR